MRVMKVCARAIVALMVAGAIAGKSSATTFTIDSSQSYLNISVGAFDDSQDPPVYTPLTSPQVPGSDTTSLSGTIEAGLGGSSVSLLSGAVSFNNQADPMQPGIGGALPGSAPANYGLIIDVQGAISGPGAARGLGADVSLAPAALVGNQFDSNGATLTLTTGSLDVNLTGFTTVISTLDISGNSGTNSGGLGTLDIVGQMATLTVPLLITASVPVEVSPGFVLPLTAIFTGQVVATATAPEPGTFTLAGLGLCGLGMIYRRSRATKR